MFFKDSVPVPPAPSAHGWWWLEVAGGGWWWLEVAGGDRWWPVVADGSGGRWWPAAVSGERLERLGSRIDPSRRAAEC